MLDVLRTDRICLKLALVDYDEASKEAHMLSSRGGKTTTQPNQFVYLRTTLLNQSRKSYPTNTSVPDLYQRNL